MTALGILWFVLIAVLIIGYFALDGFDLGVGVLYPFLGRDERSKAIMRRSVGPVWDGNEVWLLTAGGALFAAFAPAYATSFSGFYLAVMLVLFGLILRAVAIEFRAHEEDMKGLWDALFFVGSLLPALLLGVALGNVINGLPLDANGDYTGTFFDLLNPFSLVCGVVGLVHMLMQGAAWVAAKAPADDPLRSKAAKARRILAVVDLAAFALATALFFVQVVPNSAAGLGFTPLAAVFAAAYLAGTAAILVRDPEDARKDAPAPFFAGLGCAGLVGVAAATLFPNLIPATDPTLSITVANAASSETSLAAMTVIACIGVPLVLLYHVAIYRIFRGRVDDADLTY